MAVDTTGLDAVMERASGALACMDYLECEALCVEALATSRSLGEWGYYARILLPLQEARRQRRMIAAGGTIRLGSATLEGSVEDWLARVSPGCIVLTHPHAPDDAAGLSGMIRDRRRFGRVLYADNAADSGRWSIRSFEGAPVECVIDAPRAEWVDRWIDPAGVSGSGPSDWFLDACEALGDAGLSQVRDPIGAPARVAALEGCLQAVRDHEILHQRLAEAAQALGSVG